MKYLLDTDIASYYLRGKYNLLDIFQQKGIENIRISITSVAELKTLAFRNPESRINHRSIEAFSQQIGILFPDENTWELFAMIKAECLNRGAPRGNFDLLIAAIVKQNGLILVTNNTAHYADIVVTENWVAN